MGLLARVASVVLGVLLRAGALLAVLFGLHLLVSRALPQLRETARAIEQGPELEARLEAVERALSVEQASTRQFESRLQELTSRRLGEFQRDVGRWQARLLDLQAERDRLARQLDELRRERDEYCSSYNPLKRWTCSQMRQRFDAVRERLRPLIDAAETNITQAQSAIQSTRQKLAVLRDPNLSPEQKLLRLDDEESTTLRLQLDVTRDKVSRAREDAKALSTELRRIRELEQSRAGWLLSEWNAVKHRLLVIVILVLALPYVQRVANYFVLMPLVTRFSRPLSLARGSGRLDVGEARRSLRLVLDPGQVARVRSEYARPVRGKTSSLLLYDWRAPLISYASGLRVLTVIEGADTGAETTLAAPDDPNSYLLRVDIGNHPGLVVHPRHLIGVLGSPELQTRWRLFSLHAWATWQLRYVLFTGTGSIFVEGRGDVVAERAGDEAVKIEQKLVIGFDARLDMTTTRTEAFLPYLLGKTPLVDDAFAGDGVFFWEKSATERDKNVITRTFDAFFSAVGKLLGF